mmetsp:Transcript_4313/g.10767  ORF Transcript_4313/g.10767 Transcript_4313/m.10767 type:complete len:86 (+) Transcript_4313:22-279(+)|eukprot:CAMPEP_0206240012 /NCGR_PEP_ID=MMETSP0047_2-20121206/15706_1 /ASSEMBLY_ACC=CAM_ASM_000192 /TAXON_ID=195065 /ORGANISM="Chroomonas mesostigmatica_cf, Strain CCMP1168" /LENGTH=85 /DNA_ID=CAMNT_0053664755 /DNA_START=14 /DNA_END=271 /DNA_ORIENTATION=-
MLSKLCPGNVTVVTDPGYGWGGYGAYGGAYPYAGYGAYGAGYGYGYYPYTYGYGYGYPYGYPGYSYVVDGGCDGTHSTDTTVTIN